MHIPHLSRRMRTGAIVVLALAAAAAYFLRPTVFDVDTGVVARGPMRVTVDEDAQTRVQNRFVITAPVAGRLERLMVREGATIRRGEVVAWIAPLPLDVTTRRQAEARLASAEALAAEAAVRVPQAREAAAQAKRIAERRAALLAVGGIAPEAREQADLDSRARDSELAAARSRLRATGAEVDAARAALLSLGASRTTATEVRSPAAGRVLRMPEASERVVAAGAPLLELGDAATLEVVADVLSADAVRICEGQEVELGEWGGDVPLRGRVRSVEPGAFTRVSALGVDEQRVNVIIDVVDSPLTLGDGFRLEARIVVWSAAGTLQVPASALFQTGSGEWSVFVVADGRARRRAVETGHRTARSVEVLRGLSPGDEVVLFPSDQVRDGARLRARRG